VKCHAENFHKGNQSIFVSFESRVLSEKLAFLEKGAFQPAVE